MGYLFAGLLAGSTLGANACEVPSRQVPVPAITSADVVLIGRVEGATYAPDDQNKRLAKGLKLAKHESLYPLVLLDVVVEEALKRHVDDRITIGYWSYMWKPTGKVEWLRRTPLIAFWEKDRPNVPLAEGDPKYFAARDDYLMLDCGRTSFYLLEGFDREALKALQ